MQDQIQHVVYTEGSVAKLSSAVVKEPNGDNYVSTSEGSLPISVQASTEQLECSSAIVFSTAGISSHVHSQWIDAANLAVQTTEPDTLDSSPTHFESRVMGIDYNNFEDSTVSAAVSVEETLEGHSGKSEMVLSLDESGATDFRQALSEITNTEPHTNLIPDQSPDKAPAQTTHSNQQPSTPHPCTGELDVGQQNESVWKISGVAEKRREAGQGTRTCLYSPSVTTSSVCELCMRLYLNGDGNGKGTHISVSVDLTGNLKWSFNHQVSVSLLDQTEQNRHIVRKPTLLISSVEKGVDRKTVSVKCPKFAKKTVLDSLTYLCNDCIYVKCTVE